MDWTDTKRDPATGSSLHEKRITFFYWTGILLLMLAVRGYLFTHYYAINNDGILYIAAARDFYDGNWMKGLESFYPPLFPIMIAIAYPIVGDWELAGQSWPLLLSFIMLFPLYGLIRELYGREVARWALFFYAVSPYLARLSLHVRSELPYVFFLVTAIYFLTLGLKRKSWRWFFLVGISASLAYLARSEGFGFVVLAACYVLYDRRFREKTGNLSWKALAIILGFVIFSAPYIYYLKQDTGRWLISRKAGLIVSFGLSDYDESVSRVGMDESDRVDVLEMIASHPYVYFKKVALDSFRSFGVYFEAIHYSYLLFLFVGWFYFFRGRFWERADFLLFVVLCFYLGAFALLYVNRRYAVPLAPISLGWVALGFLRLGEHLSGWTNRKALPGVILLVLFLAGTLPKALKAIGLDKLYLKEAGVYLKSEARGATIITTDARVGFYANEENHIVVADPDQVPDMIPATGDVFLALDGRTYQQTEREFTHEAWVPDRTFSFEKRDKLVILRRTGA